MKENLQKNPQLNSYFFPGFTSSPTLKHNFQTKECSVQNLKMKRLQNKNLCKNPNFFNPLVGDLFRSAPIQSFLDYGIFYSLGWRALAPAKKKRILMIRGFFWGTGELQCRFDEFWDVF